jgi:hypothetical protein
VGSLYFPGRNLSSDEPDRGSPPIGSDRKSHRHRQENRQKPLNSDSMKKGKNSQLSNWPLASQFPIRKILKNCSIDSQQKMLGAIGATRNELGQSNTKKTPSGDSDSL